MLAIKHALHKLIHYFCFPLDFDYFCYQTRVDMERTRREFLCSSSQAMKMESSFDATSERECSICLFDLHLSAVGCHCSSDRYACLIHARHFCSCAWGAKFFLFRYDINELNILVEALEGKLSSVYRWARLDLGLALSSYISRDKMQVDNLSHSLDDTILENVKSQPSDISVNSAGIFGETSLRQKNNPAEAVLPLQDAKASSASHILSHVIEMKNHNFKSKLEESAHLPSNLRNSACQFSQKDISYSVNGVEEKWALKNPSFLGNDNFILLSDDEGDEPKKPVSERATDISVKHSERFARLVHSEDKASTCNYDKDPILLTPKIDAAMLSQKDLSSLPDVQRNNCSSYSMQLKDAHHRDGGMLLGSSGPDSSRQIDSSNEESIRIVSVSGGEMIHNMAKPCDIRKPNNVDNHEKVGTTTTSNLVSNVRANIGNSTCSQNNLDKYFRQKGPRIAKVVRRINCTVEPLAYGVVLSGKLWCNSQTIFPKGLLHMVSSKSINS